MNNKESVYAKTINTTEQLPQILNKAAETIKSETIDISGFGDLSWVEIKTPNGKITRYSGPLLLLNINGRIKQNENNFTSTFRCIISHDNFLAGGILVNGESTFLELSLTPLILTIEHGAYQRHKNTGLKTGSWEAAMKLSKAFEKPNDPSNHWDENEDLSVPEVGDIVRHKQFGDCKVVKTDDEHIIVQKPEGHIVNLGLKILAFSSIGTDGSVNIWDVIVKKARR